MKNPQRGARALPRDLLRASPPLAKGGARGVIFLPLALASEDSRGVPRHPPFARGGKERERAAQQTERSAWPVSSPPRRTFQRARARLRPSRRQHRLAGWLAIAE
jgi:hypothetical protein